MIATNTNVAFADDVPYTWLQHTLNSRIGEKFVPKNLQYNFTKPITRAEFCALAVRLYEYFNGEITGRVSFSDTDNINVEKMAYIGVVVGKGDNEFKPDEVVTNEQAAVMIGRLLSELGRPLPQIDLERNSFSWHLDNVINRVRQWKWGNNISPWAIDSVTSVYAMSLMYSGGEPREPLTRAWGIGLIEVLFEVISRNKISTIEQLTPCDKYRVIVISNGVAHITETLFMHAAGYCPYVGGVMSASGAGMLVSGEDALSLSQEISIYDDFQILIYNKDSLEVAFTLYDGNLNTVFWEADNFTKPENSGTFLLRVDVITRTEQIMSNGETARGFNAVRYFFRLRVE